MTQYLHYDRDQLDRQYNVRAAIPKVQDVFERWRNHAELYCAEHPARLNLRYGSHRLQTLDYFPAEKSGAALLVFIHGGYWRSLDKSDFSHLAGPLRQAGIATAIVNYRLAPEVDMAAIVADVRASFTWLVQEASRLEFDAGNIVVAGHSAGGQLAALLANTDWRETNVPEDAIKGLCGLSGVYDLEPIRLCYLNDALHLDSAQAAQFSPLQHLPHTKIPVLLSAGQGESTEFHRQLAAYARRLLTEGYPVRPIALGNGHHLDIIDQLADANSTLTQSLIAMIKGQ
ncbi:arylformamidase [Herbaspirillum sp. Sphag1AN]|uniref:alpha/beta hydrolase n=1 Tax=unclassified Herbaspirillum TaxID=2624150 RepID=UPI00161ED613|nr:MULTISPECIES: alpha/beta hydrolase [unclassified Herbaspirillum]MBB3214045.1 arylformamidase [Herbaspirillum sp. Sphag1AN]MBB3247562.1 arylformamidase [Herbaspirillum sp. Sphag64]